MSDILPSVFEEPVMSKWISISESTSRASIGKSSRRKCSSPCGRGAGEGWLEPTGARVRPMTWPDSGRARVACSEATLGGSASIVASVGTIAQRLKLLLCVITHHQKSRRSECTVLG